MHLRKKAKRPLGVTGLGIFFSLATVITLIAASSLLFPGGFLEPLWRLNPRGHEGLVASGIWAVILFLTVGLSCAAAAIGLWRGKRWGCVLSIVILVVNLAGDLFNVISGQERRAAIGIPIVLAILAYLMSRRVRTFFRPVDV
jgi:hypothetical protein